MRRMLATAAVVLATVAAAGAGPAKGSAFSRPAMRRVIVTLSVQADLTGLPRSRSARLQALEAALRSTADSTQRPILDVLAADRRAGLVASVRPLWIVNAIAVTATDTVVAELAARRDVASIRDDSIAIRPTGGSATQAEPNISLIGADRVWALGDRGQGVVVATLDTGVDLASPELAARWRGGSNSWFDPYGEHASPVDLSGHGTHTMSVIVAGDASGSGLGVAPDARWIAARVFDDRGQATTSAIHLAFQWLLDPDHDPSTADAPQVVNSSWSMTAGCNLEFEPDIQALRTARILPVFAAGNSGPSAPSDYSPANNPGALAVGATTVSDQISPDSSRGPTSCGGVSTTYPAVTAPGVGVVTLDLLGGTTTVSGTSLAAPHVAGALALLLAAHPALTAADQEAALRTTAVDLGASGPDNVFGDGRIDVAGALASLGQDSSGPVVSDLAVSGTSLRATASDALSAVAAVEWFDGADPGAGSANPMQPDDGAFDSPVEVATADVSGLSPGTHTLQVRALDASGNWGATAQLVVSVADGALFRDSFAGGDLSAWSEVRGGGQVAVSDSAALDGDGFGMRVTVTGASAAGVFDQTPAGERGYDAHFLFNPSGTSTDGRSLVIFAGWGGGRRVFVIRYRADGGIMRVRASALTSSGWRPTPWVGMSDATHAFDLVWQAGSPGSIRLTIDNGPPVSAGDLANGRRRLDRVMLGPSGGLARGAEGSLVFDAFASWRTGS